MGIAFRSPPAHHVLSKTQYEAKFSSTSTRADGQNWPYCATIASEFPSSPKLALALQISTSYNEKTHSARVLVVFIADSLFSIFLPQTTFAFVDIQLTRTEQRVTSFMSTPSRPDSIQDRHPTRGRKKTVPSTDPAQPTGSNSPQALSSASTLAARPRRTAAAAVTFTGFFEEEPKRSKFDKFQGATWTWEKKPSDDYVYAPIDMDGYVGSQDPSEFTKVSDQDSNTLPKRRGRRPLNPPTSQPIITPSRRATTTQRGSAMSEDDETEMSSDSFTELSDDSDFTPHAAHQSRPFPQPTTSSSHHSPNYDSNQSLNSQNALPSNSSPSALQPTKSATRGPRRRGFPDLDPLDTNNASSSTQQSTTARHASSTSRLARALQTDTIEGSQQSQPDLPVAFTPTGRVKRERRLLPIDINQAFAPEPVKKVRTQRRSGDDDDDDYVSLDDDAYYPSQTIRKQRKTSQHSHPTTLSRSNSAGHGDLDDSDQYSKKEYSYSNRTSKKANLLTLTNIGNSCFINSILQIFIHLPMLAVNICTRMLIQLNQPQAQEILSQSLENLHQFIQTHHHPYQSSHLQSPLSPSSQPTSNSQQPLSSQPTTSTTTSPPLTSPASSRRGRPPSTTASTPNTQSSTDKSKETPPPENITITTSPNAHFNEVIRFLPTNTNQNSLSTHLLKLIIQSSLYCFRLDKLHDLDSIQLPSHNNAPQTPSLISPRNHSSPNGQQCQYNQSSATHTTIHSPPPSTTSKPTKGEQQQQQQQQQSSHELFQFSTQLFEETYRTSMSELSSLYQTYDAGGTAEQSNIASNATSSNSSTTDSKPNPPSSSTSTDPATTSTSAAPAAPVPKRRGRPPLNPPAAPPSASQSAPLNPTSTSTSTLPSSSALTAQSTLPTSVRPTTRHQRADWVKDHPQPHLLLHPAHYWPSTCTIRTITPQTFIDHLVQLRADYNGSLQQDVHELFSDCLNNHISVTKSTLTETITNLASPFQALHPTSLQILPKAGDKLFGDLGLFCGVSNTVLTCVNCQHHRERKEQFSTVTVHVPQEDKAPRKSAVRVAKVDKSVSKMPKVVRTGRIGRPPKHPKPAAPQAASMNDSNSNETGDAASATPTAPILATLPVIPRRRGRMSKSAILAAQQAAAAAAPPIIAQTSPTSTSAQVTPPGPDLALEPSDDQNVQHIAKNQRKTDSIEESSHFYNPATPSGGLSTSGWSTRATRNSASNTPNSSTDGSKLLPSLNQTTPLSNTSTMPGNNNAPNQSHQIATITEEADQSQSHILSNPPDIGTTKDTKDIRVNTPTLNLTQLLHDHYKPIRVDVKCDKCSHDSSHWSTSVIELPQILVVHAQRWRFAHTQGVYRLVKSQKIINIDQHLDFTSFLDPSVLAKLHQQQEMLKQHQFMTIHSATNPPFPNQPNNLQLNNQYIAQQPLMYPQTINANLNHSAIFTSKQQRSSATTDSSSTPLSSSKLTLHAQNLPPNNPSTSDLIPQHQPQLTQQDQETLSQIESNFNQLGLTAVLPTSLRLPTPAHQSGLTSPLPTPPTSSAPNQQQPQQSQQRQPVDLLASSELQRLPTAAFPYAFQTSSLYTINQHIQHLQQLPMYSTTPSTGNTPMTSLSAVNSSIPGPLHTPYDEQQNQYTHPSQLKSPTGYTLYAIINHKGTSPNSGHYYVDLNLAAVQQNAQHLQLTFESFINTTTSDYATQAARNTYGNAPGPQQQQYQQQRQHSQSRIHEMIEKVKSLVHINQDYLFRPQQGNTVASNSKYGKNSDTLSSLDEFTLPPPHLPSSGTAQNSPGHFSSSHTNQANSNTPMSTPCSIFGQQPSSQYYQNQSNNNNNNNNNNDPFEQQPYSNNPPQANWVRFDDGHAAYLPMSSALDSARVTAYMFFFIRDDLLAQ